MLARSSSAVNINLYSNNNNGSANVLNDTYNNFS